MTSKAPQPNKLAGHRRTSKQPPLPLSLSRGWPKVQASVKAIGEAAGVFALLAIPLFAVRVFVVARFDPVVATALATEANTSALIVAVILTLVPFLSAAGSFACGLWAGWHLANGTRTGIGAGAAWALLGVILSVPFVLTSFHGLVDVLPVPFLYVLSIIAGIRLRLNRRLDDCTVPLMIVVFLAVGIFQSLAGGMWLPPERASIQEGGSARQLNTLYVLNAHDGDIVVFVPETRIVKRYTEDAVSEQQYCRFYSEFKTISQQLFGRAELPACPK